ncbi:MAG: quinolinate synthase NadA, partial [Oscillospiraceae bacterium]
MIREIQDEIIKLKKEKNIKILAHSYQSTDILEIADCKGDSYALSLTARELVCDTIIMCGVRFMAETVKMLSPEKKVILPVSSATCPMAEQISPAQVTEFKKQNP